MLELPRPIKPAELNELIRRAQEGDIAARNAAVMANTRLVAKLAEKVCGNRQHLDDFIQAGIAGHGAGNGLINAIMTYRLSGQPHVLGTWPAYAKRGILGALNAFAPDSQRTVTTRRHREKLRRVRKLALELRTEEAAELIPELRARGVPASECDVQCAFASARTAARHRLDDGMLAEDAEGSADEQQRAPDRARLIAALEALPEAQRAAVKKRWGFGRATGRLNCGEAESADQGEAAIRRALLNHEP